MAYRFSGMKYKTWIHYINYFKKIYIISSQEFLNKVLIKILNGQLNAAHPSGHKTDSRKFLDDFPILLKYIFELKYNYYKWVKL